MRRQSLVSAPGRYVLSRRLATIPDSPSAALRSRRAAPSPRWLPGVCQPSPFSSSASSWLATLLVRLVEQRRPVEVQKVEQLQREARV